MQKQKNAAEGFTIIKTGVGFHSGMPSNVPDYFYGEVPDTPGPDVTSAGRRHDKPTGILTETGFKETVAMVEAMKEVLGDEVGFALDCGPGFVASVSRNHSPSPEL